ncbi:MAG: cobalt-precorrin 5A hydrolase [Peptococcaceae bacterium]
MQMKIAIITLTRQGTKLGEELSYKLREAAAADLPVTFNNETQDNYQFHLFVPVKFACPSKSVLLKKIQRFSFACPLKELVALLFPKYKGLIFIMAAGIVVRLVAPLLRHKRYDPAVVVMDEQGRFAVSLLSGHLGGANELAIKVAQAVNAQAVITTATDSSNILALDMLAKKMDMTCEPLENLKKINAALVNGEKISLFTEMSLPRTLFPENVNLIFEVKLNTPAWPGQSGAVIFVTNKIIDVSSLGDTPYLFLRPKNLVAGVGCKKGIKPEEVIAALHFALNKANLAPASVKMLASISLKQEEQGLLLAASQLDREVKFFTPEEIASFTHYIYSPSNFVENTIGVGGVCEPAAYLAAKKPARIILPKTVYHRVTIALAVET